MIREHITHAGQAYYDEPVTARPTAICCAFAAAFGGIPPKPLTVRHQRVYLKWGSAA